MKRKGITLIELLVTIFCASIVIGTISASVYFVSKTSNEVMKDSNYNIKLRTVRDYFIKNKVTSNQVIFDKKTGDVQVVVNDEVKFDLKDTNILDITIIDGSLLNEKICLIQYIGSYGSENLKFRYFIN